MNFSILLLDCESSWEEKLTKQGFDVESGTIGFTTGLRSLPTQPYEKDVFIYDPEKIKQIKSTYTTSEIQAYQIKDLTPEYSLNYVFDAITNGGILLTFAKPIAKNQISLNSAYSWTPLIPNLSFTKDFKIDLIGPINPTLKIFAPIISATNPILPVQVKIDPPTNSSSQHVYWNKIGQLLGLFYFVGNGIVIILPDCKDRFKIADVFLNRIVPKLLNKESNEMLISEFSSPEELRLAENLNLKETTLTEIEGEISSIRENLAKANRDKITTIQNDDSAKLILGYYDTALRDEEKAPFYLYKIIDHLEKKYGGEKEAKDNFSNLRTEWNFIGRLANESFGDMRHAPAPGEKIKDWSNEDMAKMFDCSKKIINEYFKKLF